MGVGVEVLREQNEGEGEGAEVNIVGLSMCYVWYVARRKAWRVA
jgi:hypothetical protein